MGVGPQMENESRVSCALSALISGWSSACVATHWTAHAMGNTTARLPRMAAAFERIMDSVSSRKASRPCGVLAASSR
ncbi:hypothetical protein D3C85_1359440 [compost metagenome]